MPAFFILLLIPFTFSIITGVGFGYVLYVAIGVLTGTLHKKAEATFRPYWKRGRTMLQNMASMCDCYRDEDSEGDAGGGNSGSGSGSGGWLWGRVTPTSAGLYGTLQAGCMSSDHSADNDNSDSAVEHQRQPQHYEHVPTLQTSQMSHSRGNFRPIENLERRERREHSPSWKTAQRNKSRNTGSTESYSSPIKQEQQPRVLSKFGSGER